MHTCLCIAAYVFMYDAIDGPGAISGSAGTQPLLTPLQLSCCHVVGAGEAACTQCMWQDLTHSDSCSHTCRLARVAMLTCTLPVQDSTDPRALLLPRPPRTTSLQVPAHDTVSCSTAPSPRPTPHCRHNKHHAWHATINTCTTVAMATISHVEHACACGGKSEPLPLPVFDSRCGCGCYSVECRRRRGR